MGHNLEQLGTASLDCMGGLFLNCNPQDLPEGASPRCWDVDFVVGSVFTRAGLQSVYTFTQTLVITQVAINSGGLGVFSYTGATTPTVNEGFTLSNFIGNAFFLNGQTIFVLAVNAVAGTFTADVTGNPGTYSSLMGTATSLTGDFVGPNVPGNAVSLPLSGGNAWSNPLNVIGNTSYASVMSGSTVTTPAQPLAQAASLPVGGQALWSNPGNILTTGATFATITISSGQTQDALFVSRGGLSIPSDATVTGVSVAFQGKSSAVGTGSINFQLADGSDAAPYGAVNNVPLGTTLQTFNIGSSSYQWGTTLTPTLMSGNRLAFIVSAAVSSGTTSIEANSMVVSVTYTLAGASQILQTTLYTFAVPATSGITGVGASFQAYTNGSSTVSLQLLKNGIAVGQPITQALTSTPTVYELGGSNNLWGTSLIYSDVNNTQFGVQITASGPGTTFLNDLDMMVFITPSLANFNYIKSYIEDDGQTFTLALDAAGIIWIEDVTNDPGVLSVSLSGIIPGSFAQSSTMDNREHICFSDLSIGTDRPRTFNGTTYYPLSQIGPGAPPAFTTSSTSEAQPLQVTAYSVTTGVITFTFVAQGAFVPVVTTVYRLAGTGNPNIDGSAFEVIGSPPPSTTQFSSAAGSATGSASGLTVATATLVNTFTNKSITQDSTQMPPLQAGQVAGNAYYPGEAQSFFGQVLVWSAGPASVQPGFTLTFFYGEAGAIENAYIAKNFGVVPIYVYISGTPNNIGAGTQLITGHGIQVEPAESGRVPYFTTTTTTSNAQVYSNRTGPPPFQPTPSGNDGQFQVTLATLTTNAPIPNLVAGGQIQITGATPAAWNSTWTITDTPNNGRFNITQSQLSNGTATFTYNNANPAGTGAATVGDGNIIALSGLTNSTLFNTTGITSNDTGTTFQMSGFPGNVTVPSAPESGQGVTFGTVFLFDPGAMNVGLVTPTSIYGDTAPGAAGSTLVIGGSVIPIGSGIRQGVVYFITENEYETTPSAPFVFTTPENTNQIVASNIPIGPPDTVARGLAFTEAGQNGVPGANFYVIMVPVTTTVNGVTATVPSTIINDNVTTQIALSFTDAVLLNSREIDVQGDDLFNLIELGSSAWCVPYSNRMFYGLQLNKINNWTSGGGLTFDQGYLSNAPSGTPSTFSTFLVGGTSANLQPLGGSTGVGNSAVGWTTVNTVDQTLIPSPVTGLALYIKNTYGTVVPQVGMIYQTAYQDQYNVPIINTNTTYSVRVAVDAPSGITTGSLVIDLTDHSSIGFGYTYGSFTIPLSSMSTTTQVFTGTLLTNPFPNIHSTTGVSPLLQLRVYLANSGANADVEIDRIEVFPTLTPYLKAQVYGSYPGQPEAIDASSTGGIIDTTSENAQSCMGAFVMHDLLYIMKTQSWYSTQENPNSEPGGWGLKEVSNKVGTIGIASYDTGEEWCLTACRAGIYGFDGGEPTKISQEIWNLWEQINWAAGNTIVLRNDVVSKRMYCAIPLPTGVNPATGLPANKYTNVWLPNAPYNPTPTTPNVMLMLNYQGLADIKEMIASPEVHTTINNIVLPIA